MQNINSQETKELENMLEETLLSQIKSAEKDNPYFGEVYKSYIIEVLKLYEDIQKDSEISGKKSEFEMKLASMLETKKNELTNLLNQQITDSNRNEYGKSVMFQGAESLTYETVANLYSVFINDINIVSCDFEGKMYCTILNNDRIFNDDGTINQDIYNFDLLKKTYDFARDHGKQIKFHTFLWHNAVPENLKKEIDAIQEPKQKREMVLAFLRDYSSNLAMFIKNNKYDLRQIEALNEIANDDYLTPEVIDYLVQELRNLENNQHTDSDLEVTSQRVLEIKQIFKNDVLRNSWWRDIIGDDYYIEVFKILRDSFPNVELIYNEYNEMLPCKAVRITRIIESLIEYENSLEGKEKYPNGIFDGIGLQGHVTDFHVDKKTGGELYVTGKEILYGLRKIQDSLAANKKIYITEHDCQNICKNGQSEKNNHVYIEIVKKIANGFIVWGNSDELSWDRMFHPKTHENMRGHMIDQNGKPKQGWEQLKNVFSFTMREKDSIPQDNDSQIIIDQEESSIKL